MTSDPPTIFRRCIVYAWFAYYTVGGCHNSPPIEGRMVYQFGFEPKLSDKPVALPFVLSVQNEPYNPTSSSSKFLPFLQDREGKGGIVLELGRLRGRDGAVRWIRTNNIVSRQCLSTRSTIELPRHDHLSFKKGGSLGTFRYDSV